MSWPDYDQEQIDAVARVLRSGKVNAWTGPDVREFEAAFSTAFDVPHAIAMANGTVTLDAALAALRLHPGDEVIVTPRSFVASASSVMLAGGVPVFADVDPSSGNLTPETIAGVLTPRTRGIIPVHLGGWPCDMPAIMDLATAHDLWVIEDCAQAHGARIGNRPVGGFGTFGSFSFCQDKIMTTGGEGGMLVTKDRALWEQVWSFKDHGKHYETVFAANPAPGFRWLHSVGPGTNLRLSGMAAAIGLVQLERLPTWHAHRQRNAAILTDALSDCDGVEMPLPPDGLTHAWYRAYAYVQPDQLAADWSRDRIVSELTTAGFAAFSGSCSEVYREEMFLRAGIGPADGGRLPVAQRLGDTSLAFLVDPSVTPDHMANLASCLRDIMKRACR